MEGIIENPLLHHSHVTDCSRDLFEGCKVAGCSNDSELRIVGIGF